MPNLSSIKRQIATLSKMKDLTGALKTMSSASGAKFAKAASSAREFSDNIELAMRAAFRAGAPCPPLSGDRIPARKVILVGSDIGLVGKLNKSVLNHFSEMKAGDAGVIICGRALRARFAGAHESFAEMPKSPKRIAAVASEILEAINISKLAETGGSAVIVHNVRAGGKIFVRAHRIFPMDDEILSSIYAKKWEGRSIPMVGDDMVAAQLNLVKFMAQYAYCQIFTALVASLEAEHIARAQAMARALENIEERLSDAKILFAQKSQEETTLELIDSFSGYKSTRRAANRSAI